MQEFVFLFFSFELWKFHAFWFRFIWDACTIERLSVEGPGVFFLYRQCVILNFLWIRLWYSWLKISYELFSYFFGSQTLFSSRFFFLLNFSLITHLFHSYRASTLVLFFNIGRIYSCLKFNLFLFNIIFVEFILSLSLGPMNWIFFLILLSLFGGVATITHTPLANTVQMALFSHQNIFFSAVNIW